MVSEKIEELNNDATKDFNDADRNNPKKRPFRITEMSIIYFSHAKRIGALRALAGGLLMYLCIPTFVIVHLTFTAFLHQWLIRPLLNITRLRWKDYVILDRHRIKDIYYLDKFNCLFCGYANGLVALTNKDLDLVDHAKTELNLFKVVVLSLISIIYLPVLMLTEISIQIVFNILVSRILGMHRVSIKETYTALTEKNFAAHYPQPIKFLTRYNKNLMIRAAMLLEQIESSWCPLTHFERRKGIVYPEHHKNFFGPDEIRKMRKVLATVGTVSDRKPTW